MWWNYREKMCCEYTSFSPNNQMHAASLMARRYEQPVVVPQSSQTVHEPLRLTRIEPHE
jgi:hypothetical protein